MGVVVASFKVVSFASRSVTLSIKHGGCHCHKSFVCVDDALRMAPVGHKAPQKRAKRKVALAPPGGGQGSGVSRLGVVGGEPRRRVPHIKFSPNK